MTLMGGGIDAGRVPAVCLPSIAYDNRLVSASDSALRVEYLSSVAHMVRDL